MISNALQTSTAMDDYQHTVNAINALSTPTLTKEANDWLVEFEKQPSAWQVADQLLYEPQLSPLRFYGAKILYSKLKKQFYQLDSNTLAIVTPNLFNHLLRISFERPYDMKVCRYLCLAISALALQTNEPGTVMNILNRLNSIVSSAPRVILQMLILLPEEGLNNQVDVEAMQRESFMRQLSDSAAEIFSFLRYAWELSDLDVRLHCLKCLENWIKFTDIENTSLLKSNSLLENILSSSLQNELYLESTVDVCIAIASKYRLDDFELVQVIISYTLSLSRIWQEKMIVMEKDLSDDDMNICHSISKLFSETADLYKDIFVSEENNLSDIQRSYISQLIECSRYPYDSFVSTLPLRFFYELRSIMYNLPSSIRSRYLPVYETLLDVCILQMQIPNTSLLKCQRMSDEISEKRSEWKDTVIDCCDVLGLDQCLHRLWLHLSSECEKIRLGSSDKWSIVESVLFCFYLIAFRIQAGENSIIPQLCAVILTVPDIFELRITTINLIGKLGRWAANHEEIFRGFLNYLIGSLQQQQFCVASSRSTTELLAASAGAIHIQIDELIDLVNQMRSSNQLTFHADNCLIEGLCHYLSKIEYEKASKMFLRIINVFYQSIESIISTVQSGKKPSDDMRAVTMVSLDKLTTGFKFIRLPGVTATEYFMTVFSVTKPLIDIFPFDQIAEKLAKFYKNGFRCCGEYLITNVEAIIDHLIVSFDRYLFSGFIYAGSILVSDYSRTQNGLAIPFLYKMIWAFSTTFYSRFPDANARSEHPDVVEEYYFFISKVLRYCPLQFIMSTNEAKTIVEGAASSLSLQHRESQKGVLLFFENFVQLGSSFSNDVELSRKAANLVIECCETMIFAIFKLLTAEWSAYAIDERDGCIIDVIWNMKTLYTDAFKAGIQRIAKNLPSHALEVARMMNLFDEIVSIREKSIFSKLIDDFEFRCRRRR